MTLETSEPLFQMAAALNACGYDADLDHSAPVRAEVRADMNAALQQSEEARKSRDALCDYIAQHQLSNSGLAVGQYVSLALYLSPAPDLTPNVDETELPPQAAPATMRSTNSSQKLVATADRNELTASTSRHAIIIRPLPKASAIGPSTGWARP